ncbi:MAG: hypothetical protein E7Y34_00975, partial [Mycoplasma sp.]|nr:hypothetical protein [Mycoplasma sp.]
MSISALSLGTLFSLNQLLSFGVSQHKEKNETNFDEYKFLEYYNKLSYEQQKKLLNNEIHSILATITYKYKFFNTNSTFIDVKKVKNDILKTFEKIDKYKLFQIKKIFIDPTNKLNIPSKLLNYFNQKRISITIKFKY